MNKYGMNLFLSPKAIDDYTKLFIKGKELGSGINGFVYELTRIGETNPNYAIKILKQTLNESNIESFVREIVILAAVNHPATLALEYFQMPDETNLTPIIITRKLDGGDLKKLFNDIYSPFPKRTFTATEKTKALYGIAHAMQYIHIKGIIHRDLKPENVFLNSKKEVVLADFGVSRLMSKNKVQMTNTVGSPLFMAPEMIVNDNDNSTYDKSVDVYSFGIMWYNFYNNIDNMQLTSGPLPNGSFLLFKKVLAGDRPVKTPNIPDNVYEMMSRCWDSNVRNRPQFIDLVYNFKTYQDLHFKGTDIDEFIQYAEKIEEQSVDSSISIDDSLSPETYSAEPFEF